MAVVVVVVVGPVHPFHRRGLRGFFPPRSRAQRAAKTDEKRQKPFWWEEECRHQCCFYSTNLLHRNTSMASHQLKAIRRTRQNHRFYHQQTIGIGSKAWKTRSWEPLPKYLMCCTVCFFNFSSRFSVPKSDLLPTKATFQAIFVNLIKLHVGWARFFSSICYWKWGGTVKKLARYRCKRVIVHITFHHKPWNEKAMMLWYSAMGGHLSSSLCPF